MQVINKPVTGSFPLAKVAVLDPQLEDRIADSRNLVAYKIACLKLIDNRLHIRLDMTILFRKSTEIALKLWRKPNLNEGFCRLMK